MSKDNSRLGVSLMFHEIRQHATASLARIDITHPGLGTWEQQNLAHIRATLKTAEDTLKEMAHNAIKTLDVVEDSDDEPGRAISHR